MHDHSGTENTIELTCRSCSHFVDDPAVIEYEFPYITTFGSAYSSARGDAGICQKFGRFLDPLPAESCGSFLLREGHQG
jgi:hypothetical protein